LCAVILAATKNQNFSSAALHETNHFAIRALFWFFVWFPDGKMICLMKRRCIQKIITKCAVPLKSELEVK
jgi:hypothetical protein